MNSVGSLALNSVDNSSFPRDSGVLAEPLISGVTESLAACDWRCSEEIFLVGELSASVGTVWVQSEEAVIIPVQARSAVAVTSEQPGLLTNVSELPALVLNFISQQPGVIHGVDAQLLAVILDTFEQPIMAVAHAS